MPVLTLLRVVLRVISGGFILVGFLGTLGGLSLLAIPETTNGIPGTSTKDPWPKLLFTGVFVVQGIVGGLLWVYGPRLMLGFVERARRARE